MNRSFVVSSSTTQASFRFDETGNPGGKYKRTNSPSWVRVVKHHSKDIQIWSQPLRTKQTVRSSWSFALSHFGIQESCIRTWKFVGQKSRPAKEVGQGLQSRCGSLTRYIMIHHRIIIFIFAILIEATLRPRWSRVNIGICVALSNYFDLGTIVLMVQKCDESTGWAAGKFIPPCMRVVFFFWVVQLNPRAMIAQISEPSSRS